ncbi:MAG: hypothetical protein ACE5KQ_04210 [Thermoplasmata archaeon]
MRSRVLVVLLGALLLTLLPPGAQAHAGGGSPVAVSDSFMLTAAGTVSDLDGDGVNETDIFHAFLSDMGIPGHAGETLRYFWSVNNGAGPAVYFDIHDHEGGTGYRIYYSNTTLTEQGEWAIPGSELYMVSWQNMGAEAVEVQYSFSLLAAPPDYIPTIVTVVAVAGLLAVLWFIWRGKGTPPEQEE